MQPSREEERLSTEQLTDDAEWFRVHYVDGAGQILDFMGGDGLGIEGKRVADIGSGDGIIDIGLVHQGKPAALTGFDIVATDPQALLAAARAAGVADELPPELEFRKCEPTSIPADDDSFDVVTTWSTFEHVSDPEAVAFEIRRILRYEGVLFLQLWPFFRSEHGSHLWTWFPEGYAQLRLTPEEIEARIAAEPERASQKWARDRLVDFRSLNRLTVDGLEDALDKAGLTITKIELLTAPVHMPLDVLHDYRIVDLAISGIKLLATWV
jgi:ubiquinone/menaquinone biosynthesis C-methylase UbiE